MRAVVLMAAALTAFIAGAGATGAAASGTAVTGAATTPSAPRWHPAPGLSWQIQLSGKLDLAVAADVFEVDGVETSAATVARLHAAGKKVVCYVDAGSWEPRRLDMLMPLLRARIAGCAGKGFDGIEFDNVDGYANRTGFPLRAADQLRFNRWVAAEAHRQRLAAGLKNDLDQVRQLVAAFDWAIDEQCFEFDECTKLLPFVVAAKPVVVIEYTTPAGVFCAGAVELGFDAMRKRLALDAWRQACPQPG